MALTIHATVTSASKGSATLQAKAGQVVVPDGWAKDADAITATTEGTVKGATLELSFDGDCPLAKGQVVTIEADFAPAEDVEPETPATPAETEPDSKPRPRRPAKKAVAKKAAPAKKAPPAKKAAAKKATAKS